MICQFGEVAGPVRNSSAGFKIGETAAWPVGSDDPQTHFGAEGAERTGFQSRAGPTMEIKQRPPLCVPVLNETEPTAITQRDLLIEAARFGLWLHELLVRALWMLDKLTHSWFKSRVCIPGTGALF